MTRKEIETSARYLASKYGIPAELVFAIIEQESGWNAYATRFEPRYLEKYVEAKPKCFGASLDTERQGRATSHGLMQTMGLLCREQGYNKPFFSELSNPAYGVDHGCKYLSRLAKTYENNWSDVIAAYNAGTPRKLSDGRYVNSAYVDAVTAKWKKFQQEAQNV